MALPDSYTLKPSAIPAYFEAMLNAEAPDRFTTRFLVDLEFKSTNDRLFINILKELGFLDADGVPKDRYFEFLDRSKSAHIVAEGIRDSYSDLFAVNKNAHELSTDEVKNKLRTLYKGAKKDNLINRIASTFTSLCDYADFSSLKSHQQASQKSADDTSSEKTKKNEETEINNKEADENSSSKSDLGSKNRNSLSLDSLQYNINIVLPESRDQAVYDAIFKSLRDHLGN